MDSHLPKSDYRNFQIPLIEIHQCTHIFLTQFRVIVRNTGPVQISMLKASEGSTISSIASLKWPDMKSEVTNDS
jgi:hypothetical protein